MLSKILLAAFLILSSIWLIFPYLIEIEWYGYSVFGIAIVDAALIIIEAVKEKQ
jgi:hypothetical protein